MAIFFLFWTVVQFLRSRIFTSSSFSYSLCINFLLLKPVILTYALLLTGCKDAQNGGASVERGRGSEIQNCHPQANFAMGRELGEAPRGAISRPLLRLQSSRM